MSNVDKAKKAYSEGKPIKIFDRREMHQGKRMKITSIHPYFFTQLSEQISPFLREEFGEKVVNLGEITCLDELFVKMEDAFYILCLLTCEDYIADYFFVKCHSPFDEEELATPQKYIFSPCCDEEEVRMCYFKKYGGIRFHDSVIHWVSSIKESIKEHDKQIQKKKRSIKKTLETDFPTSYPDLVIALDFGHKITKREKCIVEEALGECIQAWDHVAEQQSIHYASILEEFSTPKRLIIHVDFGNAPPEAVEFFIEYISASPVNFQHINFCEIQ